ncbi:4-amino-4-deoxychorismate lyase [Legionella birminghamensis]|uniref:branched-chain-amino-acid transaminase n=1 Tax=Legionella birminghamensis TaxID=28083 RepID=A0A378I963_9GAMM|nr:aminotransferase class IV [Legionella birminghamensis]KTC68129.1 4-amino-4-deoxychorismate lyase [Legionella birminghamensis]STX31161.1 4-amino-4-deoxychorismate lyase [Legionella birminghamensis]
MSHSIQIQFQPPGASLCLSSADRLFLGEAVFETLRVKHFKPLYAALHWGRLKNTASVLNIPFHLSLDDWQKEIQQYIKEQRICDGGLKIILTPGSASRGLLQKGNSPHLIVEGFSYLYDSSPVNLVSCPWFRDSRNPIYQVKSLSYLEEIIARRWALSQQADDVLFFNTDHLATETSVANVFIIHDGQVKTPAKEHGLIPGVLRERLFQICKNNEISCQESQITHGMIVEAEALFTSNVLQRIKPVARFDGLEKNTAHPIVLQLSSLLAQVDEADC